jgi:protein NrfD
MNGNELFMIRSNPGIDPILSVWRWEIPIYLFLGGLVGGVLLISAATELIWPKRWERRFTFWGSLLAAAFLSIGMLALFLDLAHRWYSYRFYMTFQPTSPMSWGAWILIVAYPVMLLRAAGSMSDELRTSLAGKLPLLGLVDWARGLAHQHRKTLLIGAIVTGIGLGTYTGILLQTLVARPFWRTGLLGPLFLSSGIAGAAALFLLGRPSPESRYALVRWVTGALLAEAAFMTFFFIEKAGGLAIDRAAAGLVLAGPFTGSFISLEVFAGILAPLAMMGFALRKDLSPGRLAPILVLIGGISLRFLMVAVGQMSNFNML